MTDADTSGNTVSERARALRERQRPIKDAFRRDPQSALVTSTVTGRIGVDDLTCTVDTWAGPVRAGLHPAAGGDGTEACSADIVLEAVAACAGVTLRAVATAMGVTLTAATVRATGTWDARGTLGVDRDAPIGLTSVDVEFDLTSDADDATLARLVELAERYCVVAQSLRTPPELTVRLSPRRPAAAPATG